MSVEGLNKTGDIFWRRVEGAVEYVNTEFDFEFKDVVEEAIELRQVLGENVFFEWSGHRLVVTQEATLESLQADYVELHKLGRPTRLLDQVGDFKMDFGDDVDAMACALVAFNRAVGGDSEKLARVMAVVHEIEGAQQQQESPSTPER